ncbi:flagellar biosynthesis protein [Nitrobacter sp. Nb-311A]|nr:flagellar biosynthesis protein [Nitrobacter sp. Nb-311A]EAQ37400.1 flagellar biosynthesis protein [Nitrobacter sp. Nb-311A]MCB1392534.1 hypothetical protein [Nitrobacter sp.]MCV0385266.1 hypothetical protein [Nitrobacter sp.]
MAGEAVDQVHSATERVRAWSSAAARAGEAGRGFSVVASEVKAKAYHSH